MAVKISKAKHKHIKINIVCFNIVKHFYSDLMQLDIAAISSSAFELVRTAKKINYDRQILHIRTKIRI